MSRNTHLLSRSDAESAGMHALSGNPSDIRSIHAVVQAMETCVSTVVSFSLGSDA